MLERSRQTEFAGRAVESKVVSAEGERGGTAVEFGRSAARGRSKTAQRGRGSDSEGNQMFLDLERSVGQIKTSGGIAPAEKKKKKGIQRESTFL